LSFCVISSAERVTSTAGPTDSIRGCKELSKGEGENLKTGKPENRKTGKQENRKPRKPETPKPRKPENPKTRKPENPKTRKPENPENRQGKTVKPYPSAGGGGVLESQELASLVLNLEEFTLVQIFSGL
jgi:hypothetical protein